ncbi:MAG: glycoside hydrolase family 3 protein [Pseudonocardiales bacterium]|nr:glycoside hydrolase family 3 protein [Pseudonocardiales bacterium]
MLRRLWISGAVAGACAVAVFCVGTPTDSARPAPVSCAQATWDVMTPRARVGQLFLLGVPATAADQVSPVIEQSAPGGVFLTGRSTAGVAATAAATSSIQRAGTSASGGIGMFVATDQEGGHVQVLSGPGFSQMPTAKVQGRWKPEALQAAATGWGHELRAAGVNVNLAPVADVLSPELGTANAAIGRYDRAYGTDPAVVSDHVLAFARGMRDAGVVNTVKHFPGLGRVRENTDFSGGVVDEQTTATDPDLLPFSNASRAATPWVMVSSAIYRRIDAEQPASFSATIITTLLREEIGYRGLVVSDDLGRAKQVAAVPPGQRAVRFLRAGGDIVLTADPATLGSMIDEVVSTATSDPGFARRITEAQKRIVEAKTHLGLLPCARS